MSVANKLLSTLLPSVVSVARTLAMVGGRKQIKSAILLINNAASAGAKMGYRMAKMSVRSHVQAARNWFAANRGRLVGDILISGVIYAIFEFFSNSRPESSVEENEKRTIAVLDQRNHLAALLYIQANVSDFEPHETLLIAFLKESVNAGESSLFELLASLHQGEALSGLMPELEFPVEWKDEHIVLGEGKKLSTLELVYLCALLGVFLNFDVGDEVGLNPELTDHMRAAQRYLEGAGSTLFEQSSARKSMTVQNLERRVSRLPNAFAPGQSTVLIDLFNEITFLLEEANNEPIFD